MSALVDPAAKNVNSLQDVFHAVTTFENFIVTKRSSLIGAIELSGCDPDGLVPDDHLGLWAVSRMIYGNLHRSVTVTQYFSHFYGATAHLKERPHPLANLLSKRREAHLNTKRHLTASRLLHLFEVQPLEDLNKLDAVGFFKHATQAIFNPQSRAILRNKLSSESAFLLQASLLDRQSTVLSDTLREVVAKWSGVMETRVVSLPELWAFMRFTANLRPNLLTDAKNEDIPVEDMDLYLPDSEISTMKVTRQDVIKLSGPIAQYVRIAAVKRFGNKAQPGFWASGDGAPMAVKRGNYILMTRWKPFTELQKSLLFNRKQTELERQSISIFEALKGNDSPSAMEKMVRTKPVIRAKMDELGEAEGLQERWGLLSGYMLVFDHDPERLRDASLELDRAASSQGLSLVWESVNLPLAFSNFQPGGGNDNLRELHATGAQMAAASLIYQSSIGQPVVADLANEEAQYLLESGDGQLFHYSPFVGGRAMTVAIGPIRSGKTFFKNTLATHFLKYGGFLRAVDIDPGTETLAKAFGKEGGIFRVSADGASGLNPFAPYRGKGDQQFGAHLTELLLEMLHANDDDDMRRLEPSEQEALDSAISKTVALPPQMRTMSTLCAHMPANLHRKFLRWIKEGPGGMQGRYSHLFDNVTDAIGHLDKRVAVFNMQAVRDDPKALRPILLELFYRITLAFEDPNIRNLPKILDIDEAHQALAIPAFSDYIVKKIRTWGKWGASVQLWTQSPEELGRVEGWAAIRSAASTFIFMADPKMDEQMYMETFNLRPGECEAIRKLTPRREAYIVQPELGVSKRLIVDVEPEQYVMNTSHPREAELRDRLIAEMGYEQGIAATLVEIERLKSENTASQRSLREAPVLTRVV